MSINKKVDVYGQALADHFYQETTAPLILYTNGNLDEEGDMPVPLFFRNPKEFPIQEQIALALCSGKTLDIGAGVGSHSLYLQDQQIDVTALEFNSMACQIMRERGVKKVINEDIFKFEGQTFDTLLFLMNGIGLAQNLAGLRKLLIHLKRLINPGGQILFDSSDVALFYADGQEELPKDRYYGEIDFQYEYKGQKGEPFGWLYIDAISMHKVAEELGWAMQLIDEDDSFQYLARLSLLP